MRRGLSSFCACRRWRWTRLRPLGVWKNIAITIHFEPKHNLPSLKRPLALINKFESSFLSSLKRLAALQEEPYERRHASENAAHRASWSSGFHKLGWSQSRRPHPTECGVSARIVNALWENGIPHLFTAVYFEDQTGPDDPRGVSFCEGILDSQTA